MINTENGYRTYLKKYKFIDLFAGIGGFRIAFESFGAKCIFSSEWDKHAQIVYKNNFGETPSGDITKIKEEDIEKHDILCAGFPCQAFSISGKQKGFEDTRGTLFFEIARIAKHHQPSILFLENVKNLAQHNDGETLRIILETLDAIGYNVFYKILNASHYGIPQKRERIYILAFKKEMKVDSFSFPRPPMVNIKIKDFVLPDDKVDKYILTRNDIKLRDDIKTKSDLFGHYPLKPVRVGIVNKGGQGERIYSEHGHAVTLSAYGGGAGAKTGLYLINKKVRKLAPRECARMMGFPDSYEISEAKTQAYKQFGNSVVVDVLQRIIMEMITQGVLK